MSSTAVLVLCAIFLRVSARTLQEENTSDTDISENMLPGERSLNQNITKSPKQHDKTRLSIEYVVEDDEINDNSKSTRQVKILETAGVRIDQSDSYSKGGKLQKMNDKTNEMKDDKIDEFSVDNGVKSTAQPYRDGTSQSSGHGVNSDSPYDRISDTVSKEYITPPTAPPTFPSLGIMHHLPSYSYYTYSSHGCVFDPRRNHYKYFFRDLLNSLTATATKPTPITAQPSSDGASQSSSLEFNSDPLASHPTTTIRPLRRPLPRYPTMRSSPDTSSQSPSLRINSDPLASHPTTTIRTVTTSHRPLSRFPTMRSNPDTSSQRPRLRGKNRRCRKGRKGRKCRKWQKKSSSLPRST